MAFRSSSEGQRNLGYVMAAYLAQDGVGTQAADQRDASEVMVRASAERLKFVSRAASLSVGNPHERPESRRVCGVQ